MTGRYLLRRLSVAVGTVFAAVTAAFVLIAVTPDPAESLFDPGGTPLPGSPRDASVPLLERYLTWLIDFATLEWGTVSGEPMTAIVGRRVARTAVYVLPGAVVAYAGGIVAGFHSARASPGVDRVERSLLYVAFGLPTAVLAIVLIQHVLGSGLLADPFYDPDRSAFTPYNLVRAVAPATLVAGGLLAVQTRHARSEWQSYATTTLVRLVRAKGGGPRAVGRHILRVAAAPLVSVLVSETLGLLLLITMVTERIFRIPGFGELLFTAAVERSPPLIVGCVVVTVALGVLGALTHDLLQARIDPRVAEE